MRESNGIQLRVPGVTWALVLILEQQQAKPEAVETQVVGISKK
jgi:hypothetical protein